MRAVTAPSTRALIERVRADDEAAYGEVYDLLAPSVQRYLCALPMRLSHAEVEDAVQETFLRLFDGLERFDAERALAPYALGTARRVALELRRKARKAQAQSDLDARPSTDTPAPERAERAERRSLVLEALGALSPEQRDALALRHASRATMQELAESLSCSVPTARSKLRDAARRFAGELRLRGVLEVEGGAA
jgi:RNA polymerase sigma-70 factor (ECF subfamily)